MCLRVVWVPESTALLVSSAPRTMTELRLSDGAWRRVMADLVVGWLQTMGRELQRKPYGEADEAIVQESLMDPMLKVCPDSGGFSR